MILLVLRCLANVVLVVAVVVASFHIDAYLRDRWVRKKRLEMYEALERELDQRSED